MPRRVSIDPAAARAIGSAQIWLRQLGAGPSALRQLQALNSAPRALQRQPYLGPASVEFPGYRQLVVSGYRIIYQVFPDTGETATAGDIRVVAVFGPGQEGKDF